MSEEHVKVCRTQHTQPLVCKSSIGTQMDLPLSLHIGLKCVLLDGSKCYSMGPRKGMALATSKILAVFTPDFRSFHVSFCRFLDFQPRPTCPALVDGLIRPIRLFRRSAVGAFFCHPIPVCQFWVRHKLDPNQPVDNPT